MNVTKIKSYIGFAIKSGGAVFGADNLDKAKLYAVLVDKTVSANTLKKVNLYCERRSVKSVTPDVSLAELVMRDNVKVMGISNESLARAIIAEAEVSNERE